MIMFLVSAALLVVLCLAWLLYGLFRSGQPETDQEAVNISLARERRQLLNHALAEGAIDAETHQAEYRQLEHDLAAELVQQSDHQRSHRRGNITMAVIVSVFVPIAAGALYLKLGDPMAIDRADGPPSLTDSNQAPALADLLPRLVTRLADAPDDVQGWQLLGRTYLSLNEFAQAQRAFERALALDAQDVSTLAQLSEAIAMQRDGALAGKPMEYLQRAITIDPENEHAQWLLAIGRQQAGDHEAALQGLDRLAARAQDNPQALASIDQMRQRSLEALDLDDGVKSVSDDAVADRATEPPPGTTGENGSNDVDTETGLAAAGRDEATPGSSIRLRVTLSDAAAAAVDPEQTVFVYARAKDGPPMPLAVARLSVGDLPTVVTLDDSMAMVPAMTLSSQREITVGARVSTRGQALAQSGDWFSEVESVHHAESDVLSLNIDRQTP